MSLCTQHIHIRVFRIYFQFPSFYNVRTPEAHYPRPSTHQNIFHPQICDYAYSLLPNLPQTQIFAYIYFFCVLLECLTEFLYTHWKFARRTLKAYLSFGICVQHVFHVLLLSFSFFLYIRTLKTDNVANDERGIFFFSFDEQK